MLEELQHRDASKYPSLMPNDNNFPFEKVKHPGWAKIPSTQSRSSGSTNNIPGPSSEAPQDEGPKPPPYPPPGAGSSSRIRSPGSRWQLPIDPEKYGEENLKFINQDGKRMMSRFYYYKDGPSGQFFIPSYDETPSVAKGMVTSVGETWLMCYDAGNRAYAGYLRALFTAEEMVEMVQTSDPNEELLGDIIEIAMGILMLALKYPNAFSGWMSLEQTNATLRGIERSFLTWQQSEGVEPDRNRKRRSKPKSMGQEILLKIDDNKVKIPHRFTAIMEVHEDSPLGGEPEEEDIGYAVPSSSKTGTRSSAPDKQLDPLGFLQVTVLLLLQCPTRTT